jgi:hypothetical protein
MSCDKRKSVKKRACASLAKEPMCLMRYFKWGAQPPRLLFGALRAEHEGVGVR